MQKKIIALAIAGLSGAAFAQSNVTIYGVADLSFESVKQGGTTTAGGDVPTRSRVNTNSSYIGFKGTESLGGGMSAIYQFENGISLDTAGTATTQTSGTTPSATTGTTNSGATGSIFGGARDSFVGITGNFGTVLGGYVSTLTRSQYAAYDVMPGAAGVGGGNNGVYGKAANNLANMIFRTQAVAYVTPKFNGFSAGIAYVPNELKSNSAAAYTATLTQAASTYTYAGNAITGLSQANCGNTSSSLTGFATSSVTGIVSYGCSSFSVTNSVANKVNPYGWNLALNYENGPLKVGYSYLSLKDIGVGGFANENHKAHQLAAGYTFGGATTVNFMWMGYKGEVRSYSTGSIAGTAVANTTVSVAYTTTAPTLGGTSSVKNNSYYLGLKHVMGMHEIAGAYAKASDPTGTLYGSSSQRGANQFSLRYGYNFSKRTQAYAIYSRLNNQQNTNYDFSGGTTVGGSSNTGNDPRAWGVGIRHSF